MGWFEHLKDIGHGAVRTEVSSAQRVIFANCTGQPRSWAEAKAALDKLPEFRVEDPAQLSQKIKACEDALKASKDLLGFFSDYRKAIESARDDPSTWDRERIGYHNKRFALVADFKEKMKAAYDC